jgi:hypothetical protein
MNLEEFDWERLNGLGFAEKATGDLKDACWKGYTAVGMKNKGGKKVPNCVPVKKKTSDHSENPMDEMAIGNAFPEEPGTGPKKDDNSKLAMKAAPNYSEEEFFEGFHSGEANGAMAINQLRVMREKIDIMLGMLYPDDNLEPWMATKLANSSQNLASVADYLRFGVET